MIEIKQSTSVINLLFLMVDSTNHVIGKTGLSPTVTLSKNGAAFASPAGAVSELANGWYQVAANATDSATIGSLTLHATGTAADPTDVQFSIVANLESDTFSRIGTAGAGLTNLGTSGNNWNTVIPPTVSEFNARTIVSANYTVVSDLGAVQTADHTSTISSIDSVTTAILIDTAQIGVAGAGLTDLATQTSVNTIDSNVDAILLDTNELQSDNIPGLISTLDAVVDTVKVDTASILVDTGTTLPARLGSIEGASFSTSTDSLEAIRDRGDSAWVTGGGGGSGGATPAEVATALTDIHLDKLFAANYDPASKPGSATALLNELVENDGGVARYTVNALENGPSGSGSSAEVIAAAVFNTLQSEHKLAGTYGLYLQSNSGYVPASGHASGLTSETAPFNAYEYGQVIRANMKQDVSAFTVFEIVIQPEQGSSKNASQLPNRPKGAIIASGSDVTVGTVDVTIGDVLYAANEYLQYTTKPDDLSHPGTWRVRGTVVKSAANKLLGDFLRFTVLD
jgi:hypothetical protein